MILLWIDKNHILSTQAYVFMDKLSYSLVWKGFGALLWVKHALLLHIPTLYVNTELFEFEFQIVTIFCCVDYL